MNATAAKQTRKVCTLCNLRPAGYGTNGDQQHAVSMGYCTPCLTEGEWENVHSDDDHAGIEAMSAMERMSPKGQERIRQTDGCWVCYPELNEAQRPYTPRTRKQPAQPAARRAQLDHKAQCTHAQTPAARRACREAFWTVDSGTA